MESTSQYDSLWEEAGATETHDLGPDDVAWSEARPDLIEGSSRREHSTGWLTQGFVKAYLDRVLCGLPHVLAPDDTGKVGSTRSAVDGQEGERRRLPGDSGHGSDDLFLSLCQDCLGYRLERRRPQRTVAFGSGMACVSSLPWTDSTWRQQPASA